MKTNKEKFLELVTENSSETSFKNLWRIQNRFWIKKSQKIATKILMKLDELFWDKERFSEETGFSLERANEMLKGNYNFSLEELAMIEIKLEIEIL